MNYSLSVKVKMPDGQQVVQNMCTDSTVYDLKCQLALHAKISFDSMNVLTGYPPIRLKHGNECTLLEAGIKSGDTIIIEKIKGKERTSFEKPEFENNIKIWNTPPEPNKCLKKQIIPADNSCLFSSIYYALNGKLMESSACAPIMRQTVAEEIASDEEYYNEAFLGRTNLEYCNWIRDENSWGGGIELAILSNHNQTEIIVLDSVNGLLNKFGEDKNFSQRILLLFDGIHYDGIYLDVEGKGPQTIFSTQDEEILDEAKLFVTQLQANRQFTDVNTFRLVCSDCHTIMVGQKDVRAHYQATKHTNFRQIY